MKTAATSKKRKNRPPQRSFLDGESLVSVMGFPSKKRPRSVVTTEVASLVVKEIFFDRMKKEIVEPYNLQPSKGGEGASFVMRDGVLQTKRSATSSSSGNSNQMKHQLKTESASAAIATGRRSNDIIVGTNQCARALEGSVSNETTKPLLIVMARDIYPPTMLAHIPTLADSLGIPLLMLPGKTSQELGAVLGMRKASIMTFLPTADKALLSFVDFISQEIPHKQIKDAM